MMLSGSSQPLGPLVHVRTAHRNTPDVLEGSIARQEDFRRRTPFDRMVETDAALGEHYQRLVARFLPILSNLESGNAARDLEIIRADADASARLSHSRVLPHLSFTRLGGSYIRGFLLLH